MSGVVARGPLYAATAESPFSGHDSVLGARSHSYTHKTEVFGTPREISSGDPMQQAALGISFG